MSATKSKNANSPWMKCEKCSSSILNKDCDRHMQDCPPNFTEISHSFIANSTLYGGTLNEKQNPDVKNLTSREKDNLVFVSQSIIQLCSLAIGEWAVIKALNNEETSPVAKIVWPTNEKSITSILLTTNGLELTGMKMNENVKLHALPPTKIASKVYLTVLNAPKTFEISQEFQNRIQNSFQNQIITNGNTLPLMFYGKILKLRVNSIDSNCESDILTTELNKLSIDDQFYSIASSTLWTLFKNEAECKKSLKKSKVSKLAGTDTEFSEIQQLMHHYFHETANDLTKCKSALLYGNSGTGKTLIANTLADQFQLNTVFICSSDLYSKNSGNIEDVIKELFENAIKHAPSVIILDEMDILCPSRSSTRLTDTEKRIVATILTMFDRITEMDDVKIFLLATSNKPDNIDMAFRRYGRLDREIEIPTPSPKARKEIMQKLLEDSEKSISPEEIEAIARISHGFVGADLVSLCSRAALNAVRRRDALKDEDFQAALKLVRPSAMREVQIEVPNVKWSDIGGQEKLKLILKQSVEWPLKHPESFRRLGVSPPRGVLMYGPPGCSKTMIAKALATESGLNFLSIKGPELFSKWVGESERAVREIFRKARQVAPSVIFFDEIDALGGERSSGSSTASVQERVLAQLLTELDGVTPLGDVTILAATNRPDRMDKALLRPGRLDRIVYVPLPDEHTRREIINIKFKRMPVRDVSVDDLVGQMNGYSGAEVNAVCHEAAMAALEEDLQAECVESKHFLKALKLITPRTPATLIQIYEEYNK